MDAVDKTMKLDDVFARLIESVKTPKFWISVIIFIAALVLWQVLRRLKKKWVANHKSESTTAHVIFDVIRFLFFFVLIIVLLQINGINVTALLTGLGVASVVFGLALQDFLKDIIMGVHILTDKFFQVGDVVRYNDKEGTVISFNVRTTKLKLVDYNEILTISNRNITEIMVLSNYFDLDLTLPYYVDSDKIHETLEQLAERISHIENVEKAMYKGVQNFNDSSISYRIRYWTFPDSRRLDVRRAANRVVQDGLKEAGIPFAYNHLDVELVDTSK